MYEGPEQSVADNPADLEAWQVLGDWLQAKGDPRGELVALELAHETDRAKAFFAEHADALMGPLVAHQKTYDGEDRDAFIWKYGYIEQLRLSHDFYGDEAFDGSLVEILDLVLKHPAGRFLRDITFVFNRDPNEDTLQDLIERLAQEPRPLLRKLHFGDYNYNGPSDTTASGESEISWYSIGDLSSLWAKVPNLKTLITQCGSSESTIAGVGMELGNLDLPELVHAEFRTGGLEERNARAIVGGKFPSIQHLDIWFGDPGYGGDADADDLQPLLERTDMPKLRHLGLKNAVFADELPARLAASALAPQLESIDLSMGCLTAEGVAALVSNAARFTNLKTLDVSENHLREEDRPVLHATFAHVLSAEQRQLDDPDDIYPAVGE